MAQIEETVTFEGILRREEMPETLKLYKSDNTVLVATFNLKDSTGTASVVNVYSRERV